MIKGLIKLISIFFIIIVVTIFYLSFFGIKTKSLNNKIKSEILKVNEKINLELKSVKLLLDPLNLTVSIKTFEPKIFIEDKSLELEFIKTNISLISFLSNKFSIDNLKISTKTNEVKDLVLAVRSLKNSTNLYILSSIVKDGVIIGDLDLNFDDKGKIKNDYEAKGFIKNGKLKILKKNSINDLSFIFNLKDKDYQIKDLRGIYNKIKRVFIFQRILLGHNVLCNLSYNIKLHRVRHKYSLSK